MRYIVYSTGDDTSFSKIIKGQAEKYSEFELVELGSSGYKAAVLESLEGIEDEYICVIPPNNIPLNGPHTVKMDQLAEVAHHHNFDYVRMARVSDKYPKEVGEHIFAEETDTFLLVPYMIKTDMFRDIVSRITNKHDFLFWASLETTGYSGIFYFNSFAQMPSNSLVYWKCDLLDVLSAVLTTAGRWNTQYVNFGEKPLEALFSEYSIMSEENGVGSEGCCS